MQLRYVTVTKDCLQLFDCYLLLSRQMTIIVRLSTEAAIGELEALLFARQIANISGFLKSLFAAHKEHLFL